MRNFQALILHVIGRPIIRPKPKATIDYNPRFPSVKNQIPLDITPFTSQRFCIMPLTHHPFSRRQFLVGSTAALAVAGLPASRRLLATPAEDRFGGWPIGIQSYSLRNFNVDEAIRHTQGL